MIQLTDPLDFIAVCGLLIFALLLLLARRRIPSPADRVKMRSAAWSLLSDVQPDPSTRHDTGGHRASKQTAPTRPVMKGQI